MACDGEHQGPVYLLLLLLLATCNSFRANAQKQNDLQVGQGAPACKVQLQGDPITNKLKKAELSCTGGTVRAAADDPAVLKQLQRAGLQRAGSSTGVTWVTDSCGFEPKTCLLAICGVTGSSGNSSVPLNLQLSVQHYSDSTQYLWGAFCISGRVKAVIKDAAITDNDVAGLVVNGSADVTVLHSSFVNNTRTSWSGGAVVLGGRARVSVAASQFMNNSVDGSENFAGAILVLDSAQLTLDACAFSGNQAYYGHGGALLVRDDASAIMRNSTFATQIATQGGVLQTEGQARVNISNCTMQANWASWGGAVYVAGNSSVIIEDSSLVSNFVKDYDNEADGGACYVYDTGRLELINTTIHSNSALNFGGGIAMGSKGGQLLLGPGTSITGNTARQGGGLYLMQLLDNMAHVAHITVRNKAMVSDDIGVELVSLQLMNDTGVPATFVPRLADNKGLLPVWLRLSGPDDLPASAAIQAVFEGRPLARNTSDPVTGQALLNINLQQPPGTYELVFEVMGRQDELYTTMNVTVMPCGRGEVNITEENACLTCPNGTYSLDPLAKGCSTCPPNAVCVGGSITPVQGFWSSSPYSNQVHRCLYPPACLQGTTAQCAKGHEGNLCARCARGYGQRLSMTASKCLPCASPGQTVTLFILASLASMGFVRFLCYLNSFPPTKQPALTSAGFSLSTPASQQSLAASWSSSTPQLHDHDSDAALARGLKNAPHLDKAKNKHLEGSPSQTSVQAGPQSPFVASAQGGQAAPSPSRVPGPPVELSDLLKPFVIYLQWMLMVASVNVEWPRTLSAPYSALAWFFASGSTTSGLDCLLASSDRTLALPLQKVLFSLCVPFALLALLLCLDAAVAGLRRRCVRRARRGRGQSTHHGRIARTVIVLVFFFYPSLLRTAYSLFTCVQLDHAPPAALSEQQTFLELKAVGDFWVMDTDQLCFKGFHRGWAAGLGVPALILLCVVVPLGVMAFLWLSHGKLTERYYQQHYGFLYNSYEDRCYIWEGIVALQTCVVVAISVFGATLGAAYQCILLTAAFGIALLLLAAFQPFVHHAANLIGQQGMGCLLITAQAALVIRLLSNFEGGPQGGGDSPAANAVAAAALCVNAVFVLSFLWRAVRAVDWGAVSSRAGRLKRAASSGCSACVSGAGFRMGSLTGQSRSSRV